MNERSRATSLSIAAVERDTGLSKDTLRVWERRYGFPAPARDAAGERAYAPAEVDKLRLLKRLLDAGHRPGRIVTLPLEELAALPVAAPDAPSPREPGPPGADLRPQLDLIRAHDARSLRSELSRLLSRLGVGRFVVDVLAPLNTAVGDAWLRGQVEIFQEHVYTEVVQGLLRQAIAAIPPPHGDGRPNVLLSTFPGEPHGLGLLMAEAMFTLEACDCVSLGVQTPLWDIVLAAAAHGADIVALGFSGCMNPNPVVDGLTELRAKLPTAVQLWAGGATPVLHRRRVGGVLALASLDAIAPELRRWREAAAASAQSLAQGPV